MATVAPKGRQRSISMQRYCICERHHRLMHFTCALNHPRIYSGLAFNRQTSRRYSAFSFQHQLENFFRAFPKFKNRARNEPLCRESTKIRRAELAWSRVELFRYLSERSLLLLRTLGIKTKRAASL